MPLWSCFIFLHSKTKTSAFYVIFIDSVQRIKNTTNQEFIGKEKTRIMYPGFTFKEGGQTKECFLHTTQVMNWKKGTYLFNPFMKWASSMLMMKRNTPEYLREKLRSRLWNVTFLTFLDSRLWTPRGEKNADHGTPASQKLFRPIWLQT